MEDVKRQVPKDLHNKERWDTARKDADTVVQYYQEVNPDKANRMSWCSTTITQEYYEDGTIRHVFSSCRVRLCPICTWRRSEKVFAQVCRIVDAIKEERPNTAYLFLTLTRRNCEPGELSEELDIMFKAFHLFKGYKAIKDVMVGFCRSMEVTHNLTNDTYHPHLHLLIAVDKWYFKSKKYIKQDKWTSLWKKAMKTAYTPIVHVQKVKGNTTKAVAEVSKYSVKHTDYIVPEDWKLTVNSICTLDSALHKRRFLAFGGLMKDLHKKLNLTDPNKDPIMEKPLDMEPVDRRHFAWCSAFNQYREISLD